MPTPSRVLPVPAFGKTASVNDPVEVAKWVSGALPLPPQAEPVFDINPAALNVAQPAVPPPPDETQRLVVEELVVEKLVVVA